MITFNGRQSDDPALGIHRVLRVFFPLLPGTTDRTVDIPGMDGAHDLGFDRQPREIKVQFVMKQDNPADLFGYVREVAAWLNVREAKPFIYSYEPDRYYLARPQGIVGLDRLMNRIGFVEVTFIAYDPYAYALDTKTASFPTEPEDEITNSGSVPCPAIITATMTGPAQFLRIDLAGTNDYLLIDRDLEQDDIVTIDTARRLTLINGIDARVFVAAASTYFDLPPGNFEFNTNPGSVDLSVEYRERWI